MCACITPKMFQNIYRLVPTNHNVPTKSLTFVPTSYICTHMTNDTTIKIRVPGYELELWKGKAQLEGVGLSEWVRSRCRAEVVSRIVDGPSMQDIVSSHHPRCGCGICAKRAK